MSEIENKDESFDPFLLTGKALEKHFELQYASFEDERIQSWCASLHWHRIGYMEPPPEASARNLFQVGVNRLVAHMNGLVSIAKTERRSIRPYP